MEVINSAVQEVSENGNVLFTNTVVDGCDIITHRSGSGLVKLHALPNKCFTRFRISFGGNIAVPEDGTAGPISLAISLDGEADAGSTMIVTPTVASAYFNVSSSIYVYVRRGCCSTVGIKNTSNQAIEVQNANLVVTLG